MLSESADSGVQAVAFGAVAGDDQRRGRGQLGEGVEENVEAFDGLEPADEADARPRAARDFHRLHFCKPLFVDANTYFMPQGDEKLYHWVTNWLRYQSTHQTMAGLWIKWVVPPSRKYHLQTQLVGTNGTAVPFKS